MARTTTRSPSSRSPAGRPVVVADWQGEERRGEEQGPHRRRRARRDALRWRRTLDEPVTATIASLPTPAPAARDLPSVYSKLEQVLCIHAAQGARVRPSVGPVGPPPACLILGVMLSVNAPQAQSLGVFTGVIVIVSVRSLVVTVQEKLRLSPPLHLLPMADIHMPQLLGRRV
ncbi:hypothetical protein JB92DRAFT_3114334 [Gautieria morchelliformis]|nr:hypothetical protein JB92DRAFT_3114334 [Gautieria morchelliformis]